MNVSPHIILIDRENTTPTGLPGILKHAGYTISLAHDGSEALSELSHTDAALILTPYALPDMDGDRFCREVRTIPHIKPVPVIMFSPLNGTPKEHAALLAAGADGYLPIPCEPQDLLRRIQATLQMGMAQTTPKTHSHNDYREMLETTPLPYQSLDTNGCLVQVNRAWLDALGYEHEDEVLGRSFGDFLEPEGARLFPQRFQYFKESGRVCCVEFEMRRKDGSTMWVSFDGRIARDNQGRFIKTHCIFQDITPQKNIEQGNLDHGLLQKSYWMTLVGSVTSFLVIASFIALAFAPVSHREWILCLTFIVLALVIAGCGSFCFVRKMRQIVQFYRRQVNQREQSLKLVNENLESQVEQRTRELTRSERRYRTYIASSPLAIFVTDRAGRFTDVNPTACSLLGYTQEELLRFHIQDILSEDDMEHGRKAFNTLLQQGKMSGEFVVTHKDASHIPVSVEAVVLENEQCLNFCLDIRERKAMEEELRRTEQVRLEESLKMQKLESVGTLAGGIAHDFNNILMGIFGNIELAKLGLSQNHTARTTLARAECSLDRAVHLSNQLLTFSKGGDPIKKTMDLVDILQEVTRFDLSGSSIKPIFAIAGDLWHAEVDKGQIQQVFSNLIINARQAMADKGNLHLAMENRIVEQDDIPTLPPGRYVKIVVRDEGTGIPRDHLPRIFDPYFSTKKTGNGLGLATVYAIVAKHDGHIGATSDPGQGTTFTIHLPASENPTGKTGNRTETAATESTPGQGTILVMDDEPLVRDVMEDMLTSLGYEVDTAEDGDEAVGLYRDRLAEKDPYDVVIMDLTIPGGKGGREAVGELLEIDPQVKAIVSSGFAADAVMSRYEEFGFKGVVAKPYKLETLRKVIQQVTPADHKENRDSQKNP